MEKYGGYILTAYLLDLLGADEVLVTYLLDSIRRAVKYDNRVTAITWSGQILAALRDYADRSDSKPTDALLRAIREASRYLCLYATGMVMKGRETHGQIR